MEVVNQDTRAVTCDSLKITVGKQTYAYSQDDIVPQDVYDTAKDVLGEIKIQGGGTKSEFTLSDVTVMAQNYNNKQNTGGNIVCEIGCLDFSKPGVADAWKKNTK